MQVIQKLHYEPLFALLQETLLEWSGLYVAVVPQQLHQSGFEMIKCEALIEQGKPASSFQTTVLCNNRNQSPDSVSSCVCASFLHLIVLSEDNLVSVTNWDAPSLACQP